MFWMSSIAKNLKIVPDQHVKDKESPSMISLDLVVFCRSFLQWIISQRIHATELYAQINRVPQGELL